MEMLLHATTWRSHNHFFDDYRNISIRWRKASKESERKENNILGDYIFTETFETTGTQLASINARQLFKNVSSQYDIEN